uniref:Transmembrane protein 67 n=1 Tax=Labrus bergylta TaxID=56723 RepID=A0A3Q3ECH4_9LABR
VCCSETKSAFAIISNNLHRYYFLSAVYHTLYGSCRLCEEFFDISSISCVRCGPNQLRSTTLRCICKTGYQTITTDKASIICQQCSTDKPAVTTDGFGCIRCPGSLSDDGKCQCPKDSVLERDVSGNLLDEARCETCNGNSPALSVPNNSGDCERCQASFTNTSCLCKPPNVLVGGLCFPPGSLSTNVNPSVNFAQLKFSVQSAWFVQNLYSASAACLVFSNLTACQALGNMCVMNMHSFTGVSTDACGLFNTIYRSRAALSSTQDISYRVNLPWLYYGEEPGLAGRVLQTDPVPVGFSFRGRNKNTDIKLIAAVYNVRGEFLRWEPVGGQNIQLCPDTKTKQVAAFSFGTAYQQSCDLSVKELLDTYPEPLFYDVFMELGGGENKKLLPLPTLVNNQQYNGRFINQSMKNWYLSRRIFLVDGLSGREKSLSAQPKVIRVTSSVKIFQLVPRTLEGQVYPPLIIMTYRDVPITDIDTQTVSITFAVEYEMDQNEARMKTNTALGVMGGVAVLYSLLKTVSWKRRIASPLIDVETVMKFLLFYAGDLANVFFTVTVGTGLYWLIFYKAQQSVSVLLPLPAQEEQFVTYIGCAFALKALQLLHKLILQVSVDVFLMDWERPRSKAGRTVQAGESKREPSPVSIWRTYFVANEWNEIQTIRKISPTFQIIAVLFFLEQVLGFSNLALRDPWPTLERSPEAYTPAYSLILRYGVAATLWLCIGLLQVIFFTVFYEHFVEDKVRQFVDLCSISNISVLLLSHRCFGYYIHGRSVHGHADTNMEEMNNNLRREHESLCSQRGLLPNSELQTFQVSITNRLRVQYDRIREPFSREAHSFSDVLYYGNEATLLIFDTLFFCVVDLGSQSFVLAAVLTYLQQMILRLLRNTLGRKNLVNKTMVDERFLI